LTESSGGQCKQNLLTQDIFQLQTAFLIIPDFSLLCRDGSFRAGFIYAEGAEQEVDIRRKSVMDRIDAACAGNLKITGESPLQPDIGDNLRWTTMLMKGLSTAVGVQQTDLRGFVSQVHNSRGEIDAVVDRLLFKFDNFEFHGPFLLRPRYGACSYYERFAACACRSSSQASPRR
jgi:hypothetical protein